MFDKIATIIFILIPLLMSAKVFQTYRETNKKWYLLPIPFYLLSALAFVFDWMNGFSMLVFGFIVRVIVGLVIRGQAPR
ncbi:MAG: hypothetical protein ISR58_15990 [Anaerolineales bacterium]|nr:hypothetical protein [Chloroflexota bacterium]MBL6982675.1 hypothetical protein [Anaerolineales bacterium]